MSGVPFKVGCPVGFWWEGKRGQGWPLYDNRGVVVGWLASSELADQIAEWSSANATVSPVADATDATLAQVSEEWDRLLASVGKWGEIAKEAL